MTIPSWPAELPQRVLADNYSEGLGDGRLRTAMETGVPKTRRRFSNAGRPVSAAFKVSPDGKARIERFFNEEVGGGALPFLMPDQTHDGLALINGGGLQLLDDQGRPLINTAWWLAIFGDSVPTFQTRNRGVSYIASFPLVVLP
ncbi:hypothetical protein [Methylorubrum extorquens]|uniref:hypothetical protein n=1 Tax=Methylorubrum extorquens TaxID=408 RepID=UPI001EE57C65|nr:hypothetical protein [Methylorubrum extorquens]MCG5247985.1 hypothetical protein [Methylorubrum extorquens]